jgi:hypothetical protein
MKKRFCLMLIFLSTGCVPAPSGETPLATDQQLRKPRSMTRLGPFLDPPIDDEPAAEAPQQTELDGTIDPILTDKKAVMATIPIAYRHETGEAIEEAPH